MRDGLEESTLYKVTPGLDERATFIGCRRGAGEDSGLVAGCATSVSMVLELEQGRANAARKPKPNTDQPLRVGSALSPTGGW